MHKVEQQALEVITSYSKEEAGKAWRQVEEVRLGFIARTWANVIAAVDDWNAWVQWATPHELLRQEYRVDVAVDRDGSPLLIFGERVDPRKT